MEKATVITWGCAHNQKDSQLIEFQLVKGAYQLEKDPANADIIVFNTCTVKTPTEDKILYTIKQYEKSGKKVVIAGCLSQSEPEMISKKFPKAIILGVNAAKHILVALNQGNGSELPVFNILPKHKQTKSEAAKDWIEKPLLGSTNWNKHLNIIQINEGCLNSCTFCATKFARGRLQSFKRGSIIEAIRKQHTPEVWLTSQDTSCWGFDNNDNIANLIQDIDNIDRKFWVRIGMGNPNNLIKVVDEVVEAYHSDKIFKFLHLPVQAGNNTVLKHMKRGYTVEEYELIVEKFREVIPEMTLSTDVICGYPTETDEQFEDTITTIQNTQPSICNISRYWERKGTMAAELTQLPHSVRKARSTRLTELMQEIKLKNNKSWVGWEGEVLINEKGIKGGYQARNIFYKPIVLHDDGITLGSWENIRITDYTGTHFRGEILK